MSQICCFCNKKIGFLSSKVKYGDEYMHWGCYHSIPISRVDEALVTEPMKKHYVDSHMEFVKQIDHDEFEKNAYVLKLDTCEIKYCEKMNLVKVNRVYKRISDFIKYDCRVYSCSIRESEELGIRRVPRELFDEHPDWQKYLRIEFDLYFSNPTSVITLGAEYNPGHFFKHEIDIRDFKGDASEVMEPKCWRSEHELDFMNIFVPKKCYPCNEVSELGAFIEYLYEVKRLRYKENDNSRDDLVFVGYLFDVPFIGDEPDMSKMNYNFMINQKEKVFNKIANKYGNKSEQSKKCKERVDEIFNNALKYMHETATPFDAGVKNSSNKSRPVFDNGDKKSENIAIEMKNPPRKK